VLALVTALLAAHGNGDWSDGIYFAMEDHFSRRSGWRYNVSLEVSDGRIVSAGWNGAHRENGTDKVTRSESGRYGMVANSDAQAPWFEQAAATAQWLVENQDPTAITYTDDQGHTDAISGVSIHVVEFFDLVEEALAQGPVGYGPYQDGVYTATEESFDHGWKNTVRLTVVSGYIVAAEFDAIPEEGDKNKEEASMDGEYGMVDNSGATVPWYEQIRCAEEWLIQNQDPAELAIDEAGATDAISGVSVTVGGHFALAQESLDGAMR
jgi:major membrane immunogen (membrane-anchored lipoprotein)